VFPEMHPVGRLAYAYPYGGEPPDALTDRVTDWPNSKLAGEATKAEIMRGGETAPVGVRGTTKRRALPWTVVGVRSVTVTPTVYSPAADGVQKKAERLLPEHPGGRPEYSKVREPSPPVVAVVTTTDSPRVMAEGSIEKAVRLRGDADEVPRTSKSTEAVELAPSRSVTLAETENSPAAVGWHSNEARCVPTQPGGRPAYPTVTGGVPPLQLTASVVICPRSRFDGTIVKAAIVGRRLTTMEMFAQALRSCASVTLTSMWNVPAIVGSHRITDELADAQPEGRPE
jgi:hypothetical protein